MNKKESNIYIEKISHLKAGKTWRIDAKIPSNVVLAALARTQPGVVITIDDKLDLDTAIIYVKAFVSECQLYIDQKMSPIRAKKLTEVLPIECPACLPPTTPMETALGAASGLKPNGRFHCLRDTPIEIIRAINKYTTCTHELNSLEGYFTPNQTLPVGTTLYLHPNTPFEASEQAKTIQPGRKLCLFSNSLTTSREIAIAAATNIQCYASIYIHHRNPETTFIDVAQNLNKGAILYVDSKTSTEKIIALATWLAKGRGLSLSRNLPLATWQAAVTKLDNDSFIAIDLNNERLLISKADLLSSIQDNSLHKLEQRFLDQPFPTSYSKKIVEQNSFFALSAKTALNQNGKRAREHQDNEPTGKYNV